MSLTLADALRLTDLQPGRTYQEQVNGRTVEVKVLEDGPAPELSGQVMLQPWLDLPFTPTLTIQARPGVLPLPDPPVLPADEPGELG